MCVRGFYPTQAGFRTHDVKLGMMSPGWNVVSFRALDGLNSFNLVYIYYPRPFSISPQDFSSAFRQFVAHSTAAAAATCAPSPQPPPASQAAPPTSSPETAPEHPLIEEAHCTFRCPAPVGAGQGRTLLAITVRNGWPHTQVRLHCSALLRDKGASNPVLGSFF
jgi:hypothetical protein